METKSTVLLRDLCETVQYGYTASASSERKGPKFLRITDIVPELIDWASVPYCSIEAEQLSKYKLAHGDIVIARTGATTGYAKYLRNPPDAVFASYLVRLKIKEGIDSAFVGAVVQSAEYKRFIASNIGGAAQPNANAQVLTSYPLRLPQPPEQRRIASILSAYDDLIENNTRRIAILEEMARRTYEQWFVRFRFPGHENVQTVESKLGPIPEGWKVVPLSGLCSSVEDGDWIETKDQGGDAYRLLQISNVGLNSFVETDNFRYISADTFKRLRCREVLPGHILIARMPKPIGRAWLVTPQPWKMITAVDVAIVEPDGSLTSAEYLLHFLNSDATLAAFAAQASGTTRLRITRKQIAAMPLCAPPAQLAHRFRDLVKPMNDQIAVLVRKCANLRITRDLLLSRLISGEIDVSSLSEPEAAGA